MTMEKINLYDLCAKISSENAQDLGVDAVLIIVGKEQPGETFDSRVVHLGNRALTADSLLAAMVDKENLAEIILAAANAYAERARETEEQPD